MKNKKGFTLAEILAVILILSLLLTFIATKGFGIFNNTKKQIENENENRFKEAGNALAVQIKTCDDDFIEELKKSIYLDQIMLSNGDPLNKDNLSCSYLNKQIRTTNDNGNCGIKVSFKYLYDNEYITGNSAENINGYVYICNQNDNIIVNVSETEEEEEEPETQTISINYNGPDEYDLLEYESTSELLLDIMDNINVSNWNEKYYYLTNNDGYSCEFYAQGVNYCDDLTAGEYTLSVSVSIWDAQDRDYGGILTHTITITSSTPKTDIKYNGPYEFDLAEYSADQIMEKISEGIEVQTNYENYYFYYDISNTNSICNSWDINCNLDAGEYKLSAYVDSGTNDGIITSDTLSKAITITDSRQKIGVKYNGRHEFDLTFESADQIMEKISNGIYVSTNDDYYLISNISKQGLGCDIFTTNCNLDAGEYTLSIEVSSVNNEYSNTSLKEKIIIDETNISVTYNGPAYFNTYDNKYTIDYGILNGINIQPNSTIEMEYYELSSDTNSCLDIFSCRFEESYYTLSVGVRRRLSDGDLLVKEISDIADIYFNSEYVDDYASGYSLLAYRDTGTGEYYDPSDVFNIPEIYDRYFCCTIEVWGYNILDEEDNAFVETH